MTTQEFINKAWNGQTRRDRCSSVFKDNDNNLYSYGYHYPLLFTIGDKQIRNVSGYSNSTAKHINWTRDINAIDVEVPYDFRLNNWLDDEVQIAKLVKGQQEYIDTAKQQMDAMKRKDTQVYKSLEYDYDRAVNNLKELQQ